MIDNTNQKVLGFPSIFMRLLVANSCLVPEMRRNMTKAGQYELTTPRYDPLVYISILIVAGYMRNAKPHLYAESATQVAQGVFTYRRKAAYI